MKKLCAWMLCLLLLASCLTGTAIAEEETVLFDLLTSLLGSRVLTLTVSAEQVDGLEEFIARYGTVVCTVKHEAGWIVMDARCDGQAYLTAAADAQVIRLETNLLDLEPMELTWDALMPNVSFTQEAGNASLKVTMTGPDQELINLSCKLTGDSPEDYRLSFQGGFITGPGAVYGLWDELTGKEGSTARDFALTYDESELLVEATGEETVQTDEAGGFLLRRTDDCTVFLNEDELGFLSICTEFSLK